MEAESVSHPSVFYPALTVKDVLDQGWANILTHGSQMLLIFDRGAELGRKNYIM